METKVKIVDKYEFLLDAPNLKQKEFYLSGSRQSAKTRHTLLCCILNMIMSPKPMILYAIRLNKGETLRTTLCKDTRTILDGLKINYKEQISSNEFTLPNGSLIVISGLKAQSNDKITFAGLGSLEQFEHCFVLFDEAYEFLPVHVERVKEAMRGVKRIQYFYCLNPWVDSHWLVKYIEKYLPYNFEKLKKKSFDWIANDRAYFHRSTYKLNPFLHKDTIEEFEYREKNKTFQWETTCYGKPGLISGGIYTAHFHKIITPESINSCSYRIGIDFGKNDPTAMVLVRLSNDNSIVQVLDEFYYVGDSFQELTQLEISKRIATKINLWINNYGIYDLKIHGDCSSPFFIQDINKALDDINIRFQCLPSKKYEIEKRIDQHLSLISREKLQVSVHCDNILSEFHLREWKEITRVDAIKIPKPGSDHCIDAMDYAICDDFNEIYDVLNQGISNNYKENTYNQFINKFYEV